MMPLGTHIEGQGVRTNRDHRTGGLGRPTAITLSGDGPPGSESGASVAPSGRHERSRAATTRARTVLVVDDDPAIREFLSMALE